MKNRKEITIYFDEDFFQKLKYKAKMNGTTISDFLRYLIEEKYIKREEPKLRESDVERNEIHKYPLRLDDKLYKNLLEKMNEQNDEYINKVVIKLVNKYYNLL